MGLPYSTHGRRFNTEFAHRTTAEKPTRHGFPWSDNEELQLRNSFLAGADLEQLCKLHKRSAGGVLPRLESLGLIKKEEFSDEYYCLTNPRPPKSPTQPQPTEEPIMAQAPNIESKTFIGGREASSLTDREIFKRIAELEAEVDSLLGIKAKSVKLDALIKSTRKDIKALAEYVDTRG